jgi:adenylate kinase family enzyme
MALRVWSVLGRPGLETSLLARLLSARLRGQLLSVPDAAAAEVTHGTHAGQQLVALAQSNVPGTLLPSPLVHTLVQDPLRRAVETASDGRAKPTLVLSGFPRTTDQVRMLQMAGVPPPRVLVLGATREEAERRLAARRVCATCGEPMHELPPAKDAPAGAPPLFAHMVDESDCEAPSPVRAAADEPAAAAHRLDQYEAHTAPLLEALRAGGASAVLDVAVADRVEDTWERLEQAVGLEPLRPPEGAATEREATAAKAKAAAAALAAANL